MVTVRLYGNFRELIGKRELVVEGATVESVLRDLLENHEALEAALVESTSPLRVKPYIKIFVNGLWSAEGLRTKLKDGDVLAIFPPVGGG